MHVLEREVIKIEKEDRKELSLATTFIVCGVVLLATAVSQTPELGWFRTAGIVLGILFICTGLLFLGLFIDYKSAGPELNERIARDHEKYDRD